MKVLVLVMLCGSAAAVIRESVIMNKLAKVKPVGGVVQAKFLALTELPSPATPRMPSGRRHIEDCSPKPVGDEVIEGGKVHIEGEDYYDYVAKTVATVIFPDHIDHKFYEVTTQEPYFTVGTIEAIGYHPTTQTPNECERIYQDFLEDQYSASEAEYSEESLEMARMPFFSKLDQEISFEKKLEDMYSD